MADDGLDELVLVRAFDRKKINVLGSLVDDGISYSFAYDGSSTITIQLHDPEWVLLTSPFFDRNADDKLDAIDVELDGIWWRLTQVNPNGPRLSLTFEERDVQRLRFKFGHITVSRNKSTRAQFARRLVKSVTGGSIGFYSRELADKQPIAKGSSTTSAPSSKDAGVGSSSAGGSFKIKGAPADSEQRANVSTVLQVAQEVGATRKAVKAMLVAGIGESNFRKSASNSGHNGVFQSNQIPASDLEGQARHFLTGGRSFRAGGAMQAVKDHPDWSVGRIASYVEVSDADGSFYDAYADEADDILKAAGADLPESGSAIEVAKSYQFSVAKDEDYWTALRRLAEEVNWRAFMHRRTFYFMDDYQLLRGTPQWRAMCVTGPEMVGLPTFEWDHRGPFPQEMTLSAILPRGYLAPGDVVNVDEAGPGNGRWIVAEASGTWFGKVVTLRLVQPQVPKKEPAHETMTLSDGASSGGDGATSQVAEKLISISKQNMPYVWGGGHNGSFAPTSGGYDCSGYIGAGLHAAGLIDRPMTSGEMMKLGKPGRGKEFTIYANAGHVFLVFENGSGGRYKRADTSPQGSETQRGPHVRTNTRSTAGFVARHFEGH